VEWISLTQEREKWHGDTFLGYMKSGEPWLSKEVLYS
jgi:hypothetical protein